MNVNEIINYMVGVYNAIPAETWPTVAATLGAVLTAIFGKKIVYRLLKLEHGAISFSLFMLSTVLWAIPLYCSTQARQHWTAYGVDIVSIIPLGTALFHTLQKLDKHVLSKIQFNFARQGRGGESQTSPLPTNLTPETVAAALSPVPEADPAPVQTDLLGMELEETPLSTSTPSSTEVFDF